MRERAVYDDPVDVRLKLPLLWRRGGGAKVLLIITEPSEQSNYISSSFYFFKFIDVNRNV